MKAIALQDYGKTQGLVVLDGYEIGYKSVEEIAKKIKQTLQNGKPRNGSKDYGSGY